MGESEEQQRTHAEESQPTEPTIHTETGQEQSEQVKFIILGIIFIAIKLLLISQLEKSEVGTKDISQPEIEQSLNQQHRIPTSTEEHEGKLTKVTESAKSTAENVSIIISMYH